MTQYIHSFLIINGDAEEAARFWGSVLPNSSINGVTTFDVQGNPKSVACTLGGLDFTVVSVDEAPEPSYQMSQVITVPDQAELDRVWDGLLQGGGEPGMCGWLKDRYGISWQVVPEGMFKLFYEPDRARVERANQAMMKMSKIDWAAMLAAADEA